jgi:hypothetical protein
LTPKSTAAQPAAAAAAKPPTTGGKKAAAGATAAAAATAELAGAALVGRDVKVFWPEEQEWFKGTVSEFRDKDGKHHSEC